MKRYLFNPESGVYAGETFDERGIINLEEGITAVPPPDCSHGQVPVFNRDQGTWTVLPIPIVRQLARDK